MRNQPMREHIYMFWEMGQKRISWEHVCFCLYVEEKLGMKANKILHISPAGKLHVGLLGGILFNWFSIL